MFAGDKLETIGEGAFAGSGLESFVAPASLRWIGKGTFSGCSALRHADLGACAFRSDDEKNCLAASVFERSGLEDVVLPRALRVIEERAFAGCGRLGSVAFGDSSELEEIGDLAFGGCSSLGDFRLGKRVRELGLLCFWETATEGLEIPQ